MPQKLLPLVSLLSSSARSYLDAFWQRVLRPDSEVAYMEAQLGPAGRYVDPVFQHSPRHCVGFVRDLVKAGSIGFVEDAVENGGLFFVAKKARAQMFIIDACASNRQLFESSIWTIAHGRRTLPCRIGFSGYQERVPPDAHSRMVAGVLFLHFPLFSHRKMATQEKPANQIRLVPNSLIYPVPTKTSNGFSWTMFFHQDVTDNCTFAGSADSSLFVCRHHSTPPLLGSKKMAWDPSMLGFWLALQTATTFISHVPLQV